MSQIPTAEEFIRSEHNISQYNTFDDMLTHNDIIHLVQNFAKLHVKEALKEASEKGTARAYYSSDDDGTYDASINKSSILSAYPLENIK